MSPRGGTRVQPDKHRTVERTVASLRSRDYWAEAIVPSLRALGLPDVMALRGGYVAFFEVVPPGHQLSPDRRAAVDTLGPTRPLQPSSPVPTRRFHTEWNASAVGA
jgi:hypothetical protein